jgi:hypothetical protein
MERPPGRDGDTDHVVTVPPLVEGVVVFIVVPFVSVKELGLYVIEVGATSLTTIVRVAVSVPAVLVAVTVYDAEEATAVGVPLMVPFTVFKVKPEGSEGRDRIGINCTCIDCWGNCSHSSTNGFCECIR